MNNRFRSFMLCMVPMLACMALQNAIMIFGAQAYLVLMFLGIEEGANTDFLDRFFHGLSSNAYLMGVSLVYALMGAILFFFWYRRLAALQSEAGVFPFRDNNRDSLRGYPPYLYGGILLFALGSQFVCAYLMVILAEARPDWMDIYTKLIESLDLSGSHWDILTLLYTVLLGPICEELCFRGLTMNYSLAVMSPLMANTVQALFFGGLHANPLQSIYAFVFGFVLGLVYLETDNLLITIVAHIAFNGLAMFLGGFIGVGTTMVSFYCILLISLMAAYTGFLVIRKAQREKMEGNQGLA